MSGVIIEGGTDLLSFILLWPTGGFYRKTSVKLFSKLLTNISDLWDVEPV